MIFSHNAEPLSARRGLTAPGKNRHSRVMTAIPTFRFAPSPNGALHLGHAYSALLNKTLAAMSGGRFLVRVEDIDTARCTPALEAAMFEDLAWLGLLPDAPPMRQSARFPVYARALDALREEGLLYPAFLTRGEIGKAAAARPGWPRDPDGQPHYPGPERTWSRSEREEAIAAGAPFAWRLDMKKALARVPVDGAERWGDVVLARKDVPASYHLAVVLDDAEQEITHAVRGRDLEAATPVHRLLQRLMGLPSPVYFHHRLIADAQGAKLSKSNRATGLRALREAGACPDDIRRSIGWNEAEIAAISSQWA